jgi:Xaa-Pro aminopeptidase
MAKAPPQTARLLYANTTDWTYITGLEADTRPHVWYQDQMGQTHIFTGNRDFTAWQRHAKVDHVYNWNTIVAELEKAQMEKSFINMLQWVFKRSGAPTALEVPSDMPVKFFKQLEALHIPLTLFDNSTFFPQRVIKTPAEIEHLHIAQQQNEAAMQHAVDILRASKIGRDKILHWRGAPLTAELLRQEMNICTIKLGGRLGLPTIIAGGELSAMPHERGHGPLRADEFILIDSFPIAASGYWGDMSRTFIKGTASRWHVQVYEAVLAAMDYAFSQLKPGVDGQDIQNSLDIFFEQRGMPSGTDAHGQPYGWKKMHGLGHSVGLDIHDPGAFTLNSAPCILKPGMVTSVEPGLYYPTPLPGQPPENVGGVRIEDVVVITETGYRNLTSFPKDAWMIE